ncbi:MAG: hypothetical protein KDA51_07095, partial [Planctomycetales bacterium]|nr:hypothetical protein [Planctomycetales bacterium]
TRDPAGYVDGMSLYLYVGGNPFAYMDPTGLGKLGFFEFVGMLFTEPEVQRSAAQGAAIGAKAVGNAAVDTVVSTATLGTVDNLEVIPVSADEREFYDSSYAVSRVGTEIIGGVATAGAGKAAQAGGKGLQVASHGIEALEIGQSAVMSGRGLVDVAQNGLDARNGAQVVGGVLGLRAATSLPRTGEITGAFNASSKVASTTEALPIYPVSRARMPRIAENIEHAQLARHPAELTRASPEVIDTNRKLATSGVPRGIGSVDEYPFASTIEGGRGAWVGHVPRTEQYSQGGTLSNFYRTNGIEPGMKFKVVICD